MTQPTFSPITAAGEVRPTMPTPTPEIGRAPKAGLQRPVHLGQGRGEGTPAPNAGFALTIAHREVGRLRFDDAHARHDVELAVALVAAKRASLVGRGPTLDDVHVALDVLGVPREGAVTAELAHRFAGLSHSYVAQRALADGFDASELVAASSVSEG